MTSNYYQNHKERRQKKALKNIKIHLKKKKRKVQKSLKKDIKILLKNKKKT